LRLLFTVWDDQWPAEGGHMADDGRFFGDADPEWAVSHLAAQAAAGPVRARRRVSWQIVGGVVVTTGLVAGAFLLGTTHEYGGPDSRSARTVPPTPSTGLSTTATPSPVPDIVAPRVTMAPLPATRREPTPPEQPPVGVVPTPVAKPAPDEQPDRPSNQVGPNKPIKTPIDPDDR